MGTNNCTYASLTADDVQLSGGALADAFRAPQLNADARVREQHADDGHEVCGRHEEVIVAVRAQHKPNTTVINTNYLGTSNECFSIIE